MKDSFITYQFSIKSKEELRDLSHEELLKYIENLQDNIKQEKPPKNSNNSSISPSSEIATPSKINSKNQSLREKSSKSVGAQFGREGITLLRSNTPHEIVGIPFSLNSCKKCGVDISAIVATLKERRQVVDLELASIQTKITEYQSFSKKCPECAYDNHDNRFLTSVTPNVSYGTTIIAIVSYLSTSQYMSNKRVVELLWNLFNVRLSEGSVNNLLAKASKLSQGEITKIQALLSQSAVVGIDETGCKVNGSKHWHWTFQDKDNTLIVADKSRGTKVITDTFTTGFINACVVHDNYASYINTLLGIAHT